MGSRSRRGYSATVDILRTTFVLSSGASERRALLSLITAEIMSAPAAKRHSSEKTLSERGILQHVLSFVGAGHHAFVAPVSQSWCKGYTSAYAAVPRKGGLVGPFTVYRAIFGSPSRVQMAFTTGVLPLRGPRLKVNAHERLLAIAGKHADLATLQAAHQLGLQLSDELLCAAAATGVLDKLQWLSTQHDDLPQSIASFAAQNGNIEMLKCIKQLGIEFDLKCYETAAIANHLQVIQYLHAEGCVWDATLCKIAAEVQSLEMLQWLRENECPWEAHTVALYAAFAGNMDMIIYLHQQQPDVQFDEGVMEAAVHGNNLELCKFLRANGCPWDASATAAARGKNDDGIELLTWLRANGCDWNADECAQRAVAYKNIALLRYCFDNTTRAYWPGHKLTELLACAGAVGAIQIAQVSRQQGAAWPLVLCNYDTAASPEAVWPDEAVAWARSEGCTSLVPVEQEYVEEDDSDDDDDNEPEWL
jgi:hypothetical protein